MSSKKGKAKVSQTDLRKMMQQMKNKKSNNEALNGKAQSSQNNGISTKRLQIAEDYLRNKQDAKKLKIDSKTNSVFSSKTAIVKSSEQVQPTKSKSAVVKQHKAKSLKRSQIGEPAAPSTKLRKINNPGTKPPKAALPLISGAYSDSEGSSDDEPQVTMLPSVKVSSQRDGEGPSTSSTETVRKTTPSLGSSLPEGFFDNPEADAKMRGVETPANKMDREWESFQRELQHETGQSEQLIDEEQETGHLDREITEIDEQMNLYTLMDKLCDKKDETLNKLKVGPKIDKPIQEEKADSSASSDEEELLDWREKDAFT
ncbi:uncharacterized protein LOC143449138 [Clavelina lepadiformis]